MLKKERNERNEIGAGLKFGPRLHVYTSPTAASRFQITRTMSHLHLQNQSFNRAILRPAAGLCLCLFHSSSVIAVDDIQYASYSGMPTPQERSIARLGLTQHVMLQEMVQVGSYSAFTLGESPHMLCAVCAKLYTRQQILASTYPMRISTLTQAPADHLQQKYLSLLA